mmetsp:Transcript_26967/g.45119  ORF Transcript_26967/g.45119 Transcript_26967/m.45119 type:complete len:213 (-) Transcript_26967:892-1530(-)
MLGQACRSFLSLSQGHSSRKRMHTSNVAPPQHSTLKASASRVLATLAPLTRSSVRTLVASRDWWASRIVVSVTSTRWLACAGSHSWHKYAAPLVSRMYLALFIFAQVLVAAAALVSAATAAVAEAEAEAEREGGSGGDDAMPTGASLRYLERAPCTISCARCRSSSAGPAAAVRGGGALRLRFEDCALAVLMASIRCPSSSSAKVPSCLYLP